MYDFSGKQVLITGCGNSKGIGYAIAAAFAKQKANLILADICPLEQIQALETSLKAMGAPHVFSMNVDVSGESSVKDMVAQAEAAVKTIDILVNNAGVMRISHFLESSAEDLDLMYRVMVRGTFLCTREVGKHMIERGIKGKIINMSSIGGKRPWVYSAGYCACKSAIVSLTQSSATVLAGHGINVNGIAPGDHKTDMLDQCYQEAARIEGVSPQAFEEMAKQFIPKGDIGTVEDIANACLFLSSPLADYIVGQTLNVNGGSFMQ